MKHLLDRPIWTALTTSHAEFSQGGELAKRYPSSISPFAATVDDGRDSLHALEAIAAPGEKMLLFMADEIIVPSGFEAEPSAHVVQMIADRVFERVYDERITPLDESDAEAMLALAMMTKPGPFSIRAQCFGRFWGVKSDGRLIAMAGERMKQPGYTEVSGLCTDPAFRGRGLGRLMLKHVAGEICVGGEQPYLHAYASNSRAINLYRGLGFRLRSDMNLASIVRRG
ncbi:MAG: GNAT family N-acetyltransferase [Hyphomicrobiales bacterium]|nr:GNAT family N-acetyltransferase [Hyphomicrobiales bacterium]